MGHGNAQHNQPWRPALLVLALALAPRPAHADWKSVQQVTLGTAQVLEPGALTFGILSPIAYGVSERLTVESHPILDLLLVPNVAARYRFVERRTALASATFAYKQSFYGQSVGSGPTQGELNVGAVATWYLGDRLAFSGGPAFAMRIDEWIPPSTSLGRSGHYGTTLGPGVSLQTHYLLGSRDVVMASLLGRYDITLGRNDLPTGTLAWVHEWSTLSVIAGLSVGRFNFQPFLFVKGAHTLPVMPLLDLWWRY